MQHSDRSQHIRMASSFIAYQSSGERKKTIMHFVERASQHSQSSSSVITKDTLGLQYGVINFLFSSEFNAGRVLRQVQCVHSIKKLLPGVTHSRTRH